MKKRQIVFTGTRQDCEVAADDIRHELDQYAIVRFEAGIGWHVTVTPWA
jgi:hypothetical protein